MPKAAMSAAAYVVTLYLLTLVTCPGDAARADHLLLLESLPHGFSLDKPTVLDVRTNFSGTVRVFDASEFRVVVNVSAPSLEAAYRVRADLTPHETGLLLQVTETDAKAGYLILKWIAVGLASASALVLAVCSLYAFTYYSKERSLYEFKAEKKSLAGGSQRSGANRSRNSVQLVNLPPLVDIPPVVGREGLHGDDSLKQVPEMPEEEDAEAIEMEELTQLKLKELDSTNENEGAKVPSQERNLIRSQFNAQPKNVHKNLLKKDKPAGKMPAKRKTNNGTYFGVATSPESVLASGDDSVDSEADVDVDLPVYRGEGSPYEPGYENTDFHMPLTTFMSPSRGRQTSVRALSPDGSSSLKSGLVLMDASQNAADTCDSEFQVLADVHKTALVTETVKLSSPEKHNIPMEISRPTLTTFASPAQTAPSASIQGVHNYFRDSSESSDPPVPPVTINVQKFALTPRIVPGLGTMGDIPEDPREDCESNVSESGRSRSMYGSSEIFDANARDQAYFNYEDSDFDIPALDSEDVLSDNGLPSPLPSSLHRIHSRTRDDSSIIDQRVAFFDQHSNILNLKQRPYSSIIPRTDVRSSSDSGVSSGVSSDQTSTPVNSEGDYTPPSLPPPPIPAAVRTPDDSTFEFPPPPKIFAPLHRSSWNSPPANSLLGSGDYVTLPNNSTKGDDKKLTKPKGQGGGQSGLSSTYMNITILSVFCILGLVTGVCCKLSLDDEIRVEITIFAPKSFLPTHKNTIYFNLDKDTDVEIDEGFVFDSFVMPDPVLQERKPELCANKTCEQGCDIQTGACICYKGYKLTDRDKCTDVNECAEALTRCHTSAGCLNRKGSYDCVCSVDYYGDGKTCHDCNTPCREDQYEVQPCSKNNQKICKDCTKVCHKGYYMASQCSVEADAVCRVCQPPCLQGEYEFRTCSNYHDRQCRNVSLLPDLDASDNIIVEEERKIKESEVIIKHLAPQHIAHKIYSLDRETGLSVNISIQNMEAAQLFIPLDIRGRNVSDTMPPMLMPYAMQRFCPHPVPDYYILHYTKHQNITYHINDNGEVTPCLTYEAHGSFPGGVLNKDNSFLCTEEGPLTKLFEISPQNFQTSTIWVEKTKRCANHSHRCEQCTKQCATQMTWDPNCGTVGDQSDNGWSPRLQVCYNCCARDNCSDDCGKFHKRRCHPFKCRIGSLVEFSIFPSWESSKKGKFYCHIKPVAKQRLLEIKYSVQSRNRAEAIHTATVQVDGGDTWERDGRAIFKDDILHILVESNLGKLPDFLEGEILANNNSIFYVGSYLKNGSRVDTTIVNAESIFIHPLKPFGVYFDKTDHSKCESQFLMDSVVAGDHQKPYIPDHDLMAVAFQNNTYPFIATHTQNPPTVRIVAHRHSFLQRIFPPVELVQGSLTGNMMQNSSHWRVEVSGMVNKCPGFLKIVLSDPAYPDTPLYTCDVAITCPQTFYLHFYLPSGDAPGMDRQVIVTVADIKQVHHLRLHRPSAEGISGNEERTPPAAFSQTVPPSLVMKQETKLSVPEGFIFSIPFMVSVGGAIVLLLCLLIIGLIVQPGVPPPELPILKCHHALFMVLYMFFHFLYSIAASSSLFFLVVIAVNSHHVVFIQQHQQQAAATSASHQLELTAMHTFLEREMARQDALMNQTRFTCQKDLQIVVDDMKKIHEKMLLETEDLFERHQLETLFEQHRHQSLQRLSQSLISFREKYDNTVRTMLRQLNQNVKKTFQSIENNTWLAGARFLHGTVLNFRRHIANMDIKPFLEWANLQADFTKLSIDVSFSLPSLPKLEDIEEVIATKPQTARRSPTRLKQIHSSRIYNHWFSPFSSNASSKAFHFQHQESTQRGDDWSLSGVFQVFLAMFISFDVILLLHRMLKAFTMGKLLLYGYPEYIDFREHRDIGDDDVFDEDNRKCKCWRESSFCQAVQAFLSQFISSTFIPKAIIVVAIILLLRGILHFSTTHLTVQSLKQAGLYHSSEEYLDLHAEMVNARIKAHSEHINTVDFPAFQTWMSTYIQRHQFAFEVFGQQLLHWQDVHLKTYCQYLLTLGLADNCSQTKIETDPENSAYGVISPGCQFQPVLPRFYRRSESTYQNLVEQQLQIMLENVQAIVFDTCQVIIVFLSIIVLKELLCAVVWIFIRRSGLIRLRIIYETNQDDPGQNTG